MVAVCQCTFGGTCFVVVIDKVKNEMPIRASHIEFSPKASINLSLWNTNVKFCKGNLHFVFSSKMEFNRSIAILWIV